MVRTLACGLAALALVVGLALAAEAAKGKKGKGKGARGTVTSFDEKTGILKVAVKKKKETTDVDVNVKDVKFVDAEGAPIDAKEVAAKFPAGTKVTLVKGEDGKVTEVKIGGGKKKKKKNKE